jgi:hypothetical protein
LVAKSARPDGQAGGDFALLLTTFECFTLEGMGHNHQYGAKICANEIVKLSNNGGQLVSAPIEL